MILACSSPLSVTLALAVHAPEPLHGLLVSGFTGVLIFASAHARKKRKASGLGIDFVWIFLLIALLGWKYLMGW